jgi:hypothetical protein
MRTDEYYRAQAEECRRMAAALGEDTKRAWLQLAQSWLEMLPIAAPQGWPQRTDQDSKAIH